MVHVHLGYNADNAYLTTHALICSPYISTVYTLKGVMIFNYCGMEWIGRSSHYLVSSKRVEIHFVYSVQLVEGDNKTTTKKNKGEKGL